MSRADKLEAKLLRFPPTMRFSEVERVLSAHGYTLERVRGSHHIYVKTNAPRLDVPVHNAAVKVEYLKYIAKNLGLS